MVAARGRSTRWERTAPAIQRLLDAKDDEIASLRAQVYALQCILGEKSNDRHAQGDL